LWEPRCVLTSVQINGADVALGNSNSEITLREDNSPNLVSVDVIGTVEKDTHITSVEIRLDANVRVATLYIPYHPDFNGNGWRFNDENYILSEGNYTIEVTIYFSDGVILRDTRMFRTLPAPPDEEVDDPCSDPSSGINCG
jgi:hypothetical protein